MVFYIVNQLADRMNEKRTLPCSQNMFTKNIEFLKKFFGTV